jgi:P27 family predicted phage terminase small subunit
LAKDVSAVAGGAEVDFALLADVLRAVDRLADVRGAIDRDGVTVTGSKGQLRPHPLLVTESVLRREVAQGLDRLGVTPARRSRYSRVDRRGRIVED